MASGTGEIDFGAFPGASEASLVVTGQASIVAGSLVEAWLRPAATADHSADEHRLEPLRLIAADIVAGVGFTIYGVCTWDRGEPADDPPWNGGRSAAGPQAGPGPQEAAAAPAVGVGTRLHGKFSVAWAWA